MQCAVKCPGCHPLSMYRCDECADQENIWLADLRELLKDHDPSTIYVPPTFTDEEILEILSEESAARYV